MRKILVIEDNPDIRENLAELLVCLGHDAAACDNGITGVNKAISWQPDVIICDIVMPGIDGYAVLKELKQHSSSSSIPFIFLTAKCEREDIVKGQQLGAVNWIIKPFSEEDLVQSIERCFNDVNSL